MIFCSTFQWLWKAVGQNLQTYTGFPKLVGECGGKNYHFVHTSADVESVVKSTVRSAFEYQGQKCSACSRMYVPESLWPQVNTQIFSQNSKMSKITQKLVKLSLVHLTVVHLIFPQNRKTETFVYRRTTQQNENIATQPRSIIFREIDCFFVFR